MAADEGTGTRDGLVGSLLHGLAVLDMFDRERTVIGIGEMAQQLGLHRSTTSRLAATLAAAGYLESAGEPGRYRLAGKLAALGELVERLGETGHLAVLEGTEAVTIEVVDGWHTVRMHSWVGKRSPAHCSSMGKALLAGLPPERVDELYRGHRLDARTERTITSRPDLKKHLAEIHAQGYALDLEELEPHLCCVAAPIVDHTGQVVASVSVSGPDTRIDAQSAPAIARQVREAATRISVRLGAPRTALT